MANNVGYVHTGNTAAPEAPGQYEGVSTPPGPGGGQVTSVEPSAEEGAWDTKPAPTAPAAPAAPATEEGAWDTAPAPTAPLPGDASTINPEDTALTKAGKIAMGVPAGIGEGVFKTVAGVGNLVGLHSNFLNHLAGEDEAASGSEKVGAGAETIGEFFLGDAALKGLSLGEKFLQVAPVLKAMENFPRAAQALRVGINVGKAGLTLTDADRVAIKASPVMARLVAAGYDALRAGVVQTAQTGIRTDNAGEALTQGAGMAAGAGLIGGALAPVGAMLAKGGEAAEKAGGLRNLVTGPAPTDAQLQGQFRQTVTGALAKPASEAQQALDAAQGKLANAESTARQAATGAPEHAAITAQAQAATKAAYTKLGTDYAQAAEQAKGLIGGTTVDYGGSPLHQAAQAIANEGKTAATPLDEAFAISRPGSAKANAMVDKLADTEGTTSLDEEGNPTQLTAQNVMDYAKNLKERLRNTGWVTDEQRADRDVYHKLLDGTHETLAQLAQTSGNPQAMDVVQNMNSAYREGIGRFNNPDVKALLQGNVNDVFKRLTGGGTSVADINTAKAAIGDKAFGSLAEASLSRLAADSVDKATGEFSYKNFFNKWNGIPADVRQAMFADSVRAGAIQDDIATVQKLNTFGAVPEATQKLKDINQTIESLVGNGDTNVLLKDPERVAAMSKVVGADGMAELGKSIIQNQMLKSATTGVGEKAVVGTPNAEKVLDWMLSMKDSPEVTDALFKPTPEASANFEKLMADLKTVQSVHNMTKYGILTPVAATGVGMGVVAHGPLAIMLGTMVGTGSAVAARNIVDKIANSPAMWRTIAAMDRRAAGPVAGAIGQGTRYAAGRGLGLGVNYLQHAMTGATPTPTQQPAPAAAQTANPVL
jgi:hypothetical protein